MFVSNWLVSLVTAFTLSPAAVVMFVGSYPKATSEIIYFDRSPGLVADSILGITQSRYSCFFSTDSTYAVLGLLFAYALKSATNHASCAVPIIPDSV